MVIGNGFFTETEQDALKEMQLRSGCEVRKCVFPTIGNIVYYISINGDLFGMQRVQGKYLTRTKKNIKTKSYLTARLIQSVRKEVQIPLHILTYCTFVLHEWRTDVKLDFLDGNQYNVHPDNLLPRKELIPHEWAERMERRKNVYCSEFMRVVWSVNYVTNLDIDDCKDIAQNTFIYLCTNGYKECQSDFDITGLWISIARKRGVDYVKKHNRCLCDSEFVELQGKQSTPYEIDLFNIRAGERQTTYLRMWAEGNQPSEIAKECGCNPSTVRASICRSIQFLQHYFRHEIRYGKTEK